MFGLPQGEPSAEEKKQHQDQTNATVRNAAYAAIFLWVSPMVWHFVQKQWK
ncbi:hypothetical protein Kpol_1039p72 [Vanderwaltozyma polyspora DSM 70294]|uniref:Mitochondrial import receptor subunit TOM5 n=1 Tax=Vanderwaltozyma polyspora (strain ATCC 22028 / DSM 70294 / BCRC 21397 / CBS 2163 / NBRC 10782 / NRRL Y-8283 / UCD 57-17) TaxID=436907 RepID=A7THJ9_VANPO|nr:uncharacterized protein Kpol_1039p72 [Vanderwaltozyma polyspora DSM 70294]EDO18323.1 hypothetical protein Kpol_1039p72 [Vanderwaltozyma polyspora DSM 70294]